MAAAAPSVTQTHKALLKNTGELPDASASEDVVVDCFGELEKLTDLPAYTGRTIYDVTFDVKAHTAAITLHDKLSVQQVSTILGVASMTPAQSEQVAKDIEHPAFTCVVFRWASAPKSRRIHFFCGS